ncbi:MAG: DUF4058 family protein [Planctomycetes bacterium]|nr:DUF4058 family protein [Planctomycetota bacterium]
MRSPYPGMDPYLESPALWPDVHNRLIAAIGDCLGPALRPRYYVRLEERAYSSEPGGLEFIGRPDLTLAAGTTRSPGVQPPVEARVGQGGPAAPASGAAAVVEVEVPVPDRIRETRLVVVDTRDREVVTVLEILSPDNKRPGRGRRLYLKKRGRVLESLTHLIEIDLLRGGERMPVHGDPPGSDYRILTSRGEKRPRARAYCFGVRDAIPLFPLPLRGGDAEPEVRLGEILHGLYERAAYDLSLDYRAEPVPALAEADRAWSDGLLRSAAVR